MIFLTIRTDKPEAEVGLYRDTQLLAYTAWEAHRQLAETLHIKIKELLGSEEMSWTDLSGLVAFKGPGSFTGLRIGFSVGNALAASLQIPIVAMDTEDWIKKGIEALQDGARGHIGLPEYGAPANITFPKK